MGTPNAFVYLALVAFPAAVALCFLLLPPRRALLATLIGGWLFLPHFDGQLRFSLFHTKAMYVPAVVLLGSIFFDSTRWRSFRPRWIDLPMVLLCAQPFVTALNNSLGTYEAASAMFEAMMQWGAPYLLGRAYLGHARGLRDCATALVTAAIIYTPFCLWEFRMSPQLHFLTYGFRPWGFAQAVRYGGYRPSVFMQHGLALGMFMTLATLVAYWLWRTGALRRDSRIGLRCAILLVTTLLCKSTGAILLLFTGIAVLEATRRARTSLVVLTLALTPVAYCSARLSNWSAEPLVSLSRRLSAERAESLEFRINNEDQLITKAKVRSWLGWGRFGRSFTYDDQGQRDGGVTDSLWIIAFGVAGLVGLALLGVVLALPSLALLQIFPGRHWADPRLAPASVFAVATLLWALDNLLNNMMCPIYPAICGALLSLCAMAWTAKQGVPQHQFA
ncbi:MAG TPA: hypothetical protein VMK12_19355 [Anaeromyxobacteraceae bacterium]|nr:hypothetical protein [Anaeromyxobacteraceae bacterium]